MNLQGEGYMTIEKEGRGNIKPQEEKIICKDFKNGTITLVDARIIF